MNEYIIETPNRNGIFNETHYIYDNNSEIIQELMDKGGRIIKITSLETIQTQQEQQYNKHEKQQTINGNININIQRQ